MKQSQLKKDLFIYSILIILSILFYFVLIPKEITLRNSWSGDISFTSRTFPYMLFFGLGIVAIIGVVQTLFRMKTIEKGKSEKSFKELFKELLIPIYFMTLLVLYGVLFDKFGYIIATAIVPPTLLYSLKCRKWKYYLALLGFAAIVYVVFKIVLRIPL